MRKILATILILMSVCFTESYCQDPHFSQFYSSPLYVNPAFAGTTNLHRVTFNQRVQWPVLLNAFSTSAFSYDLYHSNVKSGFGVLFSNDRAGSAGLRTINAGVVYSYKIQMPNKWVITPGIYFGYGSKGIDRSKLVLGDQIDFGNTDSPTIDPVVSDINNNNYFDFSTGVLFYNKHTWLGASWWHINRPSISFLENIDRLPSKISVHGGTRIQFYGGPGFNVKTSYLSPSFVFNHQGPSSHFDIGLNYHVDPIVLGFWYRGIPIKKDIIDNTVRDAIVLNTGLNFKSLIVQYSYDFTISQLGIRSGGAHELSIQYHFQPRSKPGKVKRSAKILPCPSFIPYDKGLMK